MAHFVSSPLCGLLGLIEGKLDSKNQVLRVDFAIARDVQDKDLLDVLAVLKAWSVRSESLLAELSSRVNDARGALQQEEMYQRQFEDRVKDAKEKISKMLNKSGAAALGAGGGQTDKKEMRVGLGCDFLFLSFVF